MDGHARHPEEGTTAFSSTFAGIKLDYAKAKTKDDADAMLEAEPEDITFPKLLAEIAHFADDILLLGPPSITSTASSERAHHTIAKPDFSRSSQRGDATIGILRRYPRVAAAQRVLLGKKLVRMLPMDATQITAVSAAAHLAAAEFVAKVDLGKVAGLDTAADRSYYNMFSIRHCSSV